MSAHTVRVTLSGTGASIEDVVKALNDAGYTAGPPAVVAPPAR